MYISVVLKGLSAVAAAFYSLSKQPYLTLFSCSHHLNDAAEEDEQIPPQ